MIWSVMQAVALALFVGGSIAISTTYMYQTYASNQIIAWAFVAVVAGMELTKPVAVRAAFGHFGLASVVPGVIGAVVCVTLSAYLELQVVARGREAYALATSGVERARGDLAARRAELRERLDGLGPTRTAAELAPLVVSAEALAGDCGDPKGRVARQRCEDLSALKSEAARAGVADEVRAEIAALDTRKDAVQPETAEARSISAVAQRLGANVEAAQIDKLLGPILVVLLQAGAVVAAAVGPRNNLGPHPRAAPPANPRKQGLGRLWATWAIRKRNDEDQTTDDPVAQYSGDAGKIVEALRENGGSLNGSQKAIAARVGVSRATLQRQVAQLASEGVVTTRSDKTGTTISLCSDDNEKVVATAGAHPRP